MTDELGAVQFPSDRRLLLRFGMPMRFRVLVFAETRGEIVLMSCKDSSEKFFCKATMPSWKADFAAVAMHSASFLFVM